MNFHRTRPWFHEDLSLSQNWATDWEVVLVVPFASLCNSTLLWQLSSDDQHATPVAAFVRRSTCNPCGNRTGVPERCFSCRKCAKTLLLFTVVLAETSPKPRCWVIVCFSVLCCLNSSDQAGKGAEGIPKNKNTQHRQKNTYTNKNQMFETQWGYYKIWNILECCGSLWFAFILSQTLGQFIYVVLNVIW